MCGWAWNETQPTRPTRLLIQVDGAHAGVVVPQDFRADLVAAGIGHGCFAFSWRVPDLYRDGQPHEVRIIHSEFNQELPHSPRMIMLAASTSLAAARTDFVKPFVNNELTLWPNGVQGEADTAVAEIAPGLVVAADPNCGNARYMLIEPRLQAGRTQAIFGTRISFDELAPWWLHHRLAPQPHPQLVRGVMISVELALGEAEDPIAQRPCEIWLSRQTKAGFEKVRRLSRGRVFRRATLLTYMLQLSPGEQKLANAKLLYVSVTVEKCRSLRAYPGQVVRSDPPPPEGFRGFEDRRMDGAFAECLRLARVNNKVALFATLLPPLPGEAPADPRPEARPPALSSSTGYPFVQVIIPVYNGDAPILECLRSVQAETTTPFQVLIVNDGSRQHTNSMLQDMVASDPRFVMLDRQVNKGYTKSINEAIKLTSAEWVVILNSDTVLSKGWLAKMLDAALSATDIGMVGALSNAASYQSVPRIKNANGSWSKNDFMRPGDVPLVQAEIDKVTERAYPEMPLLNGFCTLIKRDVFDQAGLYDEDAFPIGYGEENDLCIRARKAGFKLVVADDCFVFHRKSVSFGTKRRKPLTRAGSLELMNKHPGVSLSSLEQMMQDNPVLARLRRALANLEKQIG